MTAGIEKMPFRTASQMLTGWGRSTRSAAEVAAPATSREAENIVAEASSQRRALLARGLGRSYGDAAQCAGGLVLDMTECDALLEADFETGLVRAEAGLSLDALLRRSVPRGWFVPVTPGTRHVSLGGALAADVHGKNHHRDGSFARGVKSATLAAPAGRVEVAAGADSEAFWATAGGMGMTGVLLDVELQLMRIET
ncbi:MAG: FAD-binding oxidoreductase, partial [Acidimicrobiales bacterium]